MADSEHFTLHTAGGEALSCRMDWIIYLFHWFWIEEPPKKKNKDRKNKNKTL